MFTKILIANRGEIAIRVARTARAMGIETVAVYSDADRHALHLSSCDEACLLGPASAAESYLRGDRVIDIALQTGAQAIHPGYGFLSENADFAEACAKAGLVFIGPPAASIRAMGSKSEAKALMQQANVPLVPGYHGDDQSDAVLFKASSEIGYPQLIKASAGGGGKGMRIVENEAEFGAALTSARREAKSSFGDEKVLLERYLIRPRHIEVQVFADQQGNAVHLFERDCSIQRRHQKIVEEAPAPDIDQALRDKLTEAALRCTRAINYQGAGTIEFLADASGQVYFMEMNTRLQVEHPVTEKITGLDLVEWQLRVAAGEALPRNQKEISMQGHAIEVRLYAEDAENDFLPSSGTLSYLKFADENNNRRVDSGIQNGDQIGVFYDPMMAKLIAFGDSREKAIEGLSSMLEETCVLGIQSNLGYLQRVIRSRSFERAELHTGFVELHPELNDNDLENSETMLRLAAGLLIPEFRQIEDSVPTTSPWDRRDAWRLNLVAEMSIPLSVNGETTTLLARKNSAAKSVKWFVGNDKTESEISVEWQNDNEFVATIADLTLSLHCVVDGQSVEIFYRGRRYRYAIESHQYHQVADSNAANNITAPMPGTLVALNVDVGQQVKSGESLAVLEAMKMEHNITAAKDGKIAEIFYKTGDQVDSDHPLMILE